MKIFCFILAIKEGNLFFQYRLQNQAIIIVGKLKLKSSK